MSEYIPSEQFEALLEETLSSPEPDPVFVRNLRSQLTANGRTLAPKRFLGLPRLAWSAAIVFVVAVVVFLALSPVGAAAMKRILGYIPGIGVVEPGSQLKVLSEPVTVEQEGIQLTAENGIVDNERTVLLIRVEGLTSDATLSEDEETPTCMEMPKLRLPTGDGLSVGGAEGYGWETGYLHRMVFPAIPFDTTKVTLEIPCLLPVVPGEWPQDWEVPLQFKPAGDLDMLPVIELPEAPASATSPVSNTIQPDLSTESSPDDATAAPSQIAIEPNIDVLLAVEKQVELDTGYILMGSIQPNIANGTPGSFMSASISIYDSNGRDVPYQEVAPDQWQEPGSSKHPWAYQIEGKEYAWPLTLTVEAGILDIDLISQSITFRFDPGVNPQVDQVWELGLDVPVGQYTLHVVSARAIESPARDSAGYEFTVQSDQPVVGAVFMDADTPGMGGGGGGGGGGMGGREPFVAAVMYDGEFPDRPITIGVMRLSVLVQGPWSTTWSPEQP